MGTKFQPHSETSYLAALAILESASTLRAEVFRFIRDSKDGATDQEIQIGLDMDPSTQRPRRIELLARHMIEKCGERPTKSGRLAAVWIVKPIPPGAPTQKDLF